MHPDKGWLSRTWLLVGVALVIALIVPLAAEAGGEVGSSGNHSIPPWSLTEPSSVSGFDQFMPANGELNFRLDKGKTGRLDYSFRAELVEPQRVCLHFRTASYVQNIFLFYRQTPSSDWRRAALREFHWPLSDEPVCLPIPPGEYSALRFQFTGGGGNVVQPMRATIDGISVRPQNGLDQTWVIYPLPLLVALALALPGFLLARLLFGRQAEPSFRIAALFPLSVLFFLFLYLCLLMLQWLGVAGVPMLGAICLGLFAALMTFWFRRENPAGEHPDTGVVWSSLAVYLCAVLSLTALVAGGMEMPLWGLDYNLINQLNTYGAFGAHDPVLHYVNGRAIADQEPFRKYYANRQLMFLVQDREILPGVIYALFRQLGSAISPVIGRSYAIYTMFAIACNAMLIFPATALLRRYLPGRGALFAVAVLSLNAFVLVNYYLAWFKLAAAAMFLCGLLFLLLDNRAVRNWLMAGISWGLAANLHAGSALFIPLILLWQTWSVLRWNPFRGVLYSGMLVGLFVLANVPWSLTKAEYYPDNHTLLKSHYLGGRDDPGGLLASARQLMRQAPLAEQLPFRLRRLENALRLTEVKEMPALAGTFRAADFFREWDLREFRYAAFYLYPALLFALVAVIMHRRRDRPHDDLDREATVLMRLSLATLFFLLFAAYGKYDPDLTYHLPMALLVTIYLLFVRRIFAGPVLVKWLFILFLGFSAWRLAAPYWA